MTRISSGAKKSGPPTHANKFAYTHNRGSKLTKAILAMPISGLCVACREMVEWRKRFRKYKPLTVAKKCVRCEQKTVKEAYHIICNPCAAQHKICAKCMQVYVGVGVGGVDVDVDVVGEESSTAVPLEKIGEATAPIVVANDIDEEFAELSVSSDEE